MTEIQKQQPDESVKKAAFNLEAEKSTEEAVQALAESLETKEVMSEEDAKLAVMELIVSNETLRKIFEELGKLTKGALEDGIDQILTASDFVFTSAEAATKAPKTLEEFIEELNDTKYILNTLNSLFPATEVSNKQDRNEQIMQRNVTNEFFDIIKSNLVNEDYELLLLLETANFGEAETYDVSNEKKVSKIVKKVLGALRDKYTNQTELETFLNNLFSAQEAAVGDDRGSAFFKVLNIFRAFTEDYTPSGDITDKVTILAGDTVNSVPTVQIATYFASLYDDRCTLEGMLKNGTRIGNWTGAVLPNLPYRLSPLANFSAPVYEFLQFGQSFVEGEEMDFSLLARTLQSSLFTAMVQLLQKGITPDELARLVTQQSTVELGRIKSIWNIIVSVIQLVPGLSRLPLKASSEVSSKAGLALVPHPIIGAISLVLILANPHYDSSTGEYDFSNILDFENWGKEEKQAFYLNLVQFILLESVFLNIKRRNATKLYDLAILDLTATEVDEVKVLDSDGNPTSETVLRVISSPNANRSLETIRGISADNDENPKKITIERTIKTPLNDGEDITIFTEISFASAGGGKAQNITINHKTDSPNVAEISGLFNTETLEAYKKMFRADSIRVVTNADGMQSLKLQVGGLKPKDLLARLRLRLTEADIDVATEVTIPDNVVQIIESPEKVETRSIVRRTYDTVVNGQRARAEERARRTAEESKGDSNAEAIDQTETRVKAIWDAFVPKEFVSLQAFIDSLTPENFNTLRLHDENLKLIINEYDVPGNAGTKLRVIILPHEKGVLFLTHDGELTHIDMAKYNEKLAMNDAFELSRLKTSPNQYSINLSSETPTTLTLKELCETQGVQLSDPTTTHNATDDGNETEQNSNQDPLISSFENEKAMTEYYNSPKHNTNEKLQMLTETFKAKNLRVIRYETLDSDGNVSSLTDVIWLPGSKYALYRVHQTEQFSDNFTLVEKTGPELTGLTEPVKKTKAEFVRDSIRRNRPKYPQTIKFDSLPNEDALLKASIDKKVKMKEQAEVLKKTNDTLNEIFYETGSNFSVEEIIRLEKDVQAQINEFKFSIHRYLSNDGKTIFDLIKLPDGKVLLREVRYPNRNADFILLSELHDGDFAGTSRQGAHSTENIAVHEEKIDYIFKKLEEEEERVEKANEEKEKARNEFNAKYKEIKQVLNDFISSNRTSDISTSMIQQFESSLTKLDKSLALTVNRYTLIEGERYIDMIELSDGLFLLRDKAYPNINAKFKILTRAEVKVIFANLAENQKTVKPESFNLDALIEADNTVDTEWSKRNFAEEVRMRPKRVKEALDARLTNGSDLFDLESLKDIESEMQVIDSNFKLEIQRYVSQDGKSIFDLINLPNGKMLLRETGYQDVNTKWKIVDSLSEEFKKHKFYKTYSTSDELPLENDMKTRFEKTKQSVYDAMKKSDEAKQKSAKKAQETTSNQAAQAEARIQQALKEHISTLALKNDTVIQVATHEGKTYWYIHPDFNESSDYQDKHLVSDDKGATWKVYEGNGSEFDAVKTVFKLGDVELRFDDLSLNEQLHPSSSPQKSNAGINPFDALPESTRQTFETMKANIARLPMIGEAMARKLGIDPSKLPEIGAINHEAKTFLELLNSQDAQISSEKIADLTGAGVNIFFTLLYAYGAVVTNYASYGTNDPKERAKILNSFSTVMMGAELGSSMAVSSANRLSAGGARLVAESFQRLTHRIPYIGQALFLLTTVAGAFALELPFEAVIGKGVLTVQDRNPKLVDSFARWGALLTTGGPVGALITSKFATESDYFEYVNKETVVFNRGELNPETGTYKPSELVWDSLPGRESEGGVWSNTAEEGVTSNYIKKLREYRYGVMSTSEIVIYAPVAEHVQRLQNEVKLKEIIKLTQEVETLKAKIVRGEVKIENSGIFPKIAKLTEMQKHSVEEPMKELEKYLAENPGNSNVQKFVEKVLKEYAMKRELLTIEFSLQNPTQNTLWKNDQMSKVVELESQYYEQRKLVLEMAQKNLTTDEYTKFRQQIMALEFGKDTIDKEYGSMSDLSGFDNFSKKEVEIRTDGFMATIAGSWPHEVETNFMKSIRTLDSMLTVGTRRVEFLDRYGVLNDKDEWKRYKHNEEAYKKVEADFLKRAFEEVIAETNLT